MVQLKQHGVTLHIQSVLLVGVKHAHLNKNIIKLNLKLRESSKKENIVFIDLNEVFTKNGKLSRTFSSKDDIHLSGEGYFAWKNSIDKFIKLIPNSSLNTVCHIQSSLPIMVILFNF